MKKINQLRDLYKSQLESLGIYDVGDGYLSRRLSDDEYVPYVILGRRVTLPLDEFVRAASPTADHIAFHPLSEDVLSGQSPVMRSLRLLVLNKLNDTIGKLAGAILIMMANTKSHGSLTSTQMNYLKSLPSVDEKCVANFNKILDEVESSGGKKFINIYLRRAGQVRDVNYKRKASVSFPIIDELNSDDQTIYGVSGLRKGDIKVYKALFDLILPDADVQDTYSSGSNSNVATYYHALLTAYYVVAGVLNATSRVLDEPLKKLLGESLIINLDWYVEFQDFNKFRDLIPSCPFNVGDTESDDAQLPKPTEQPNQTPVQSPAAMQLQQLQQSVPQLQAPTIDTRPAQPVTAPAPATRPISSLGVPTQDTVSNVSSFAPQTNNTGFGQPAVTITGLSPEYYQSQQATAAAEQQRLQQLYLQQQQLIQQQQQLQMQMAQANQFGGMNNFNAFNQSGFVGSTPNNFNQGFTAYTTTEQVGHRRGYASQPQNHYSTGGFANVAPTGQFGPTGLPVFK